MSITTSTTISPLALVLGAIAPFPVFVLASADSDIDISSPPPPPPSSATSSSSTTSSLAFVVPPKTHNLDDSVSDDELSTCVEAILPNVLARARSTGCGDNESLFRGEITSAVSATCASESVPDQAASAAIAVRVLESYCALELKRSPEELSTTNPPANERESRTDSNPGTASTAPNAPPLASTTYHPHSRPRPRATRGGSSHGVRPAVIAAAVIVPLCALGIGLLMWCIFWRRRRRSSQKAAAREEEQMRIEKQQRELEVREMPPRRVETIRATTEFKWPARISETPRMTMSPPPPSQPQPQPQMHMQPQQPLHQYHHRHHQPHMHSQQSQPRIAEVPPEKELFVHSPTAPSFHSSGATLSPAHDHNQYHIHDPEYHISPGQPHTPTSTTPCPDCLHQEQQLDLDLLKHNTAKQLQQQQHRHPALGLHQTEPAELPHHDLPDLRPQELPAAVPPPAWPQELEGSVSVSPSPVYKTPTRGPPRSRFSYQR